jgi:hypothetical protein
MYRDSRGTLYHPHLQLAIPLGTREVERYRRPEWTFNKVLYVEKEGFFEALRDARWPERYDCALVSSKGFASGAARDLLDLLVETDEPITLFCLHDADSFGTMILETLAEETRTRGARKVRPINLGLEPWEAVDMGLQVEPVKAKEERAVAQYIWDYDEEQGTTWASWLQEHRVELNAMSTPGFLSWLDAKMAEHGIGKVIPPEPVLLARSLEHGEKVIRTELTQRILEEADFETQVENAMVELSKLAEGDAPRLPKGVRGYFVKHQAARWIALVDAHARELAAQVLGGLEHDEEGQEEGGGDVETE